MTAPQPPRAGTPPARPRATTLDQSLHALLERLGDPDTAPLNALRTRDPSDPAIAVFDSWAALADVLTFYQDRIGAENYLATATELRSLLELARLTGYTPRPGVAASTYLAFTADTTASPDADVAIPAGDRVQSTPGPGQLPQIFETSEPLLARGRWNQLAITTTRPATLTDTLQEFYLAGTGTGLHPNDMLMLPPSTPRQILTVSPDHGAGRTHITLTGLDTKSAPEVTDAPGAPNAKAPAAAAAKAPAASGAGPAGAIVDLDPLVAALAIPPRQPPATPVVLHRSLRELLAPDSDLALSLITALQPQLFGSLDHAWAATTPTSTTIQALRVRAAPFGANAPQRPVYDAQGHVTGFTDWPRTDNAVVSLALSNAGSLIISRGTLPPIEHQVGPGAAGPITGLPLGDDLTVTITDSGDSQPPAVATTITLALASGPSTTLTLSTGEAQAQIGGDPDIAATEVPLGQSRTASTPRRFTAAYRATAATPPTSGPQLESFSPPPLPATLTVALVLATPALLLDAVYDRVVPGSPVVIREGPTDYVGTVTAAAPVQATGYGLTPRVTQLTLDPAWVGPPDLTGLREVTIYTGGEPLDLAPVPDPTPLTGDTIELDTLVSGLSPGRRLIIAGERSDLPGVAGVPDAEVAMLGAATDTTTPDGTPHTTLRLATPLTYGYRRDSVTLWGNVVEATQGQSRDELLGLGDASTPYQTFTLRQGPLTYLPAATPSGVASTLTVQIDGLLWSEIPDLATAGAHDRVFTTRTDHSGAVSVIFGDGVHGARLPTDAPVQAHYRTGLGASGNTPASQINQAMDRPAGVRAVTNPGPATGGGDPDGVDSLRANAPAGVAALDRVVSLADYSAVAQAHPGIGKAHATKLPGDTGNAVLVTVTGVDDTPIDQQSETVSKLRDTYTRLGDPSVPVTVTTRALSLLLLEARITPRPDAPWDALVPRVRQAVLTAFSFEARDLEQDVHLGEIVSVIQTVDGVRAVDVTALGAVPEGLAPSALPGLVADLGDDPPLTLAAARAHLEGGEPQPAGLLLASGAVPDTLILQEAP